MRKTAVATLRNLGLRLVQDRPDDRGSRFNPSHAPLGMLDVERITRVSPPVSTIVSRPLTTAHVATSKV